MECERDQEVVVVWVARLKMKLRWSSLGVDCLVGSFVIVVESNYRVVQLLLSVEVWIRLRWSVVEMVVVELVGSFVLQLQLLLFWGNYRGNVVVGLVVVLLKMLHR